MNVRAERPVARYMPINRAHVDSRCTPGIRQLNSGRVPNYEDPSGYRRQPDIDASSIEQRSDKVVTFPWTANHAA